MSFFRRWGKWSHIVIVAGGLIIAYPQVLTSVSAYAATIHARAAKSTVPNACTVIPAVHVAVALGNPRLKVKGSFNGGPTWSSCSFSYDTEQLSVEIYPAAQYAQTAKVDTQLWGKPSHPAGLGPKGDYFFSTHQSEATILFVKGPYLGELLTELGPTNTAVIAGAKRLAELGPVFYASLKS
jgi:hypothetical protein